MTTIGNITVNTTLLFKTFTTSIDQVIIQVIIPILMIILAAYIFLRTVKYILSKLASRRLITGTLVDQIYKPLSLVTYLMTAFIVIYITTQVHEIVYLIIAFIIIVLLASFNIISDLVAYYVILWGGRLRVGDLVELPTYNIRGRIVSIDMTSTAIRKPDGSIIYIPNHSLISVPVNTLSQTESRISMKIRISLPKDARNAINTIIEIEDKIREKILRTKLVSRPQNIIINLRKLERYRAVLEVVVPLAAPEPRTHTINSLINTLTDVLLAYDPEFIIVSPEAEKIIRG